MHYLCHYFVLRLHWGECDLLLSCACACVKNRTDTPCIFTKDFVHNFELIDLTCQNLFPTVQLFKGICKV